jgi:hypothetical protein
MLVGYNSMKYQQLRGRIVDGSPKSVRVLERPGRYAGLSSVPKIPKVKSAPLELGILSRAHDIAWFCTFSAFRHSGDKVLAVFAVWH